MEGDDSIFLDLEILNDRRGCRKRKVYGIRKNPFDCLNDKDFVDLYRFDKCTARKIVDEIKDDIKSNCRQGSPISTDIMVLATIRYMAKGAYQKDIAEAHGISQQSMTTVVQKVVCALASRMQNFIQFPLDQTNLQTFKTDFFDIAGFPQCIGAIECTHIKIKNPGGEFGGRHRCRKGFYSINVQVICDANYQILDIVARWRGSVHDSRIWRESLIKEKLEQANLGGGVILGDNGYPASRILLTPFRQSSTLIEAQQRYNSKHIATRNKVEQLFGQLKNKFRCCFNGISVSLNTAKNMIVAISVLYNIAKATGQPYMYDDDITEDPDEVVSDEEDDEINASPMGSAFRNEFINRYFN